MAKNIIEWWNNLEISSKLGWIVYLALSIGIFTINAINEQPMPLCVKFIIYSVLTLLVALWLKVSEEGYN